MNYSSLTEVASLVPRLVDGSGNFTASTQPTSDQVTVWLSQVSAILDAYLQQNGFEVPIEDNDAATLILSFFVSQEVAAICEGVRGSGRFGASSKSPHGQGRFSAVYRDVAEFVDEQSNALERMGVNRPRSELFGIHHRSSNNAGEPMHPYFQREAFNNTDINWDE